MATKFYWHEAASGVAGTLPAAGVSVSSVTPDRIDDGGTNRSMDVTIGVSQTSKSDTTAASTTAAGRAVLARFISAPVAAQTIAAQTPTFSGAFSESNANSDFTPSFVLALWRPSTGSVVGVLWDLLANVTEPGTTQTAGAITSSVTTSVVALDGDVLVLEVWRPGQTQGMAVAYTNTVFYDGTTEASVTSCASFVSLPNTIAFSTGAATSLVIPRRTDRGLIMQPRRPRP